MEIERGGVGVGNRTQIVACVCCVCVVFYWPFFLVYNCTALGRFFPPRVCVAGEIEAE